MRIIKIITAFLFLILTSTHSIAGIGLLTDSTGVIFIKRGNSMVTGSKGTPVEINDEIITKNGRTRIIFNDGTSALVTESSSLLIDDFVYTPSSKSGKLGMKATSGTIRYVSGNIAHNNPNSVKINTPTATIAVRGTDFVMSVNETGASMIILMPSCEVENNINLKGLICGSGIIDVSSGDGSSSVRLDKPGQATMVETAAAPPSPPVVVDLNGSPVGNGLMLSPPRTGSGASIVSAAKSAAEATGDRTSVNSVEARQVATKGDTEAQAQKLDTERAAAVALELGNKLVEAGVKITDVSNNETVYKMWKDGSQTQQTGWGYERLSPSGFNYTHIVMPMDTKALVVVTQDMVTDAYNSNTQSSRSYGTIVVNQSYR